MSPAAPTRPDDLAARLLHEPAHAPAPRSGPGLLLSCFIAFHVLAVVAYNLPGRGPLHGLKWTIARLGQTETYLQTIGSTQSWQLFAPDVARANHSMRVLVRDSRGTVTDLGVDIAGRLRYPYWTYDRLRKVNRRLTQDPRFLPAYAAWVCRDWARRHGGQAPAGVELVRLRVPIPPPAVARAGSPPRRVEETPEASFACADLPHGQLPPALRRRYGLPPGGEDFRAADMRTWWDQRQAGAGAPARGRRAPLGESPRGEATID